jgi:predicted nuclease of predicted toxin-antitoxin system
MKFLIDAQLPHSLKQLFISKGYDCIHTSEMQMGNETQDRIINDISAAGQRIVISENRTTTHPNCLLYNCTAFSNPK